MNHTRKCFSRYITTKTIKQMEKYRLRGTSYNSRRLLLPLSFGPCSSSLLYILDNYLHGQFNRMKKVAYELVVVHVDFHPAAVDRDFSMSNFDQFKARFNRHLFILLGLEESMNLEDIDWATLGRLQKSETGNLNEQLQQFLSSISSQTARADIINILLTRLLVHVAKKNGCESILYGDSTTKLAEKTLSEIAKGRGISLPWQVCDSKTHGLGFHYPMREIFRKELVSFSMITPPLHDLVTNDNVAKTSANSKLANINDLMAQYFESAEDNYPNLVANVVRTSSRLGLGAYSSKLICGICGLPCNTDGDSNSKKTSGPALPDQSNYKATICYGCSQLVHGNILGISSIVDR